MIPKWMVSWKALFNPKKGKGSIKASLGNLNDASYIISDALNSLFGRQKSTDIGELIPMARSVYGDRVPYPYQIEAQSYFKKFKGRCLVADEMGLGKTFEVLMYCVDNYAKRPIIIVCPAYLKRNWANECNMMNIRPVILEHRTPYRFDRSADAYIINYDILGNPLDQRTWCNELLSLDARILIADEAHILSNPATNCTINITRLARNIDCFFPMTGTPITSGNTDLFNVLNMLLPDEFSSAFTFAEMYACPKKVYGKWVYKGAKKARLLNHKLRRLCMIRRRKEDVIADLPEKVRIVLPITLSQTAMNEYHHALYYFGDWLKQHRPERMKDNDRSEQFRQIEYLKQLVAGHKKKVVVDWINDYLHETDDKLMVFGIHREVVTSLNEHFKNNSTLVHGSITGTERHERFQQFNTNPACRIIFGNLKACGEGWSSRWPTSAHIEFDWIPRTHIQASERGHGVNRGRHDMNCTSYYLVAAGTIEENICRLLQRKQEIADRTIDGMVEATTFNIYEELVQELRKELTNDSRV